MFLLKTHFTLFRFTFVHAVNDAVKIDATMNIIVIPERLDDILEREEGEQVQIYEKLHLQRAKYCYECSLGVDSIIYVTILYWRGKKKKKSTNKTNQLGGRKKKKKEAFSFGTSEVG